MKPEARERGDPHGLGRRGASKQNRQHLPSGSRRKQLPCQVCRLVLRAFNAPRYTDTDLGTVADILSTSCRIHISLLLTVLPPLGSFFTGSIVPSWIDNIVYLRSSGDRSVSFHVEAGGIEFEHPNTWMLSNFNHNVVYRGYGRVFDPEWIDLRLIQEWISACDSRHGKRCRRAYGSSTITRYRPNLLIDTWRKCLMNSMCLEPYIALSYVWGRAPNLKTIQANLEVFLQPGSLEREEIASQIPRCIRDAIDLTKLLHERYLWVDSLCIVQDDEKKSHDEITRMASIYANAVLTIVSANGKDANYGLRGIRMVSLPRRHPQRTAKLLNGAQIVERSNSTLNKSTWSKRGWTFQETLFSQRKLIFCDETITWKCPCASWCEDSGPLDLKDIHHLPNWNLVSSPHVSQLFTLTWPDLGGYGQLVCDFNQRDLTYQEDVVNAFSGVTTPLSASFHGGFLYGMPEIFFDAALLWMANGPITRRTPSQYSSSKLSLPSWSWMGWQGKIDPLSWDCCDHIKQSSAVRTYPTGVRTVPLIQWYAHDKEKKVKRQLNSALSKYRDYCYSNNGAELPVGWKRWHYNPQPGDRDGSEGFPEFRTPKYFFKHESDGNTEFWYPITIPNVVTVPESLVSLPFVSCRTTRCWLDASGPTREEFSSAFWVSLRNRDGVWAGALNLHSPLFPLSSKISSRKLARCELIAVSMGYVNEEHAQGGFLELAECCHHKERPKISERYEFYNVLWIEWKDGIAYRKCLGRVEKHMWEVQPLEWIDVTLG
ncbi:HET domain containing protein [Hyaloscypha variabilis]